MAVALRSPNSSGESSDELIQELIQLRPRSRRARRRQKGRCFICLGIAAILLAAAGAGLAFILRAPWWNTLQRVGLAEFDHLAVCNDGSSAAYYWKRGSNSQSWFVYLEGGGWCWDVASCQGRGARLTSSGWLDHHITFNVGILSGWSPVGDFNLLYLPYCSSDAHMADVDASENPVGFHFRGARIVQASLRHAIAQFGMADRDLVIFGGGSAGARGAMVHLDTLKTSGVLPHRVRLLGYLDSPYYLEMPPFAGLTEPEHRVALQTQHVVELMKNQAVIAGPGLCELDEPWKCAFGEYRIPLLKTPFLMIASMYDWYQLQVAQGVSCCPFPQQQHDYFKYADEFANLTRQRLEALPQVLSGASGVLSSSCYDHHMSKWREFSSETTLGLSIEDALRQALNAFEDHATPMPRVVDTCRSFNCGTGCAKHFDLKT